MAETEPLSVHDSRHERIAVDDGCTLATTTTGTPAGRLPWVMLHGGPGGWDYLRPVAELVADCATVHRFDFRGCGSSDETIDGSIERLVADVEYLRRRWRHRRWIVLGHSFGAAIALALSWAYPETVATVVYVAGTGAGDWEADYRRRRQVRWSVAQATLRSELAALPVRTPEEETELLVLNAIPDFCREADARAWARSAPARVVSAELCRAQVAELDSWTPREVIGRCVASGTPIVAVRGDADPRPRDPVARLVAAVPGAGLIDLPGAGHFPWVERPHQVRRVLQRIAEETT